MGWFTRKERVIERVVEKEVIKEKEVVKYLLGDVEKVTLYLAYTERTDYVVGVWFATPYTARKEFGLYHSCAQAFEENPGCKVEAKTYWKVGDQFVKSPAVVPVHEVKPKPKRDKGKAKA